MTQNGKEIKKLRQKIEKMREELKRIGEGKEEYSQEEMIELSQKLDDLLNKLYEKLY